MAKKQELNPKELAEYLKAYKNSPEWYAKSSGRAEQTMAPHEYLMALPENALADAVFTGAGKIMSPLVRKLIGKTVSKAASKSIPKIIDNPVSSSLIDSNVLGKNIPSGKEITLNNIDDIISRGVKDGDGANFKGIVKDGNSAYIIKEPYEHDFKLPEITSELNSKYKEIIPTRQSVRAKTKDGYVNIQLQDLAKGKYIHHLTENDLNKLTQSQINSAKNAISGASDKGVYFDLIGSKNGNLLYEPDNGFQFIDLSSSNRFYNNQDAIDAFRKQVKTGIEKATDMPADTWLNSKNLLLSTPSSALLVNKALNNSNDMTNEYKSGGWLKGAVNPKHRGFCSPVTKKTCTPKRKAFAMTMKKHHGFHADGGELFGVDGYQDHGFGMNQPDYATGGNMYFLGGVKPPTAMQGSAGNVAGSIGGMIPTDTRGGAAGAGALKGAELGMNFGPWGAAAGAAILGTAGFINQGNKMKRADFASDNLAMKQRNELLNIKALGGFITASGVPTNMATEYAQGGLLTEFNSGLSHEENKLGGVLQGYNEDGEPNRVEQGETKYKDYIFSDRLKLDEQAVNDHNLPKSMINKTFAEASKRISKLHKERPHDPITRDTMKSKMDHLMMANDEIRDYEQSSIMAMGGHLYDGLSQKTGRLQLGSKYYDDKGSEFLSGRVGDEFFSPGLKQPLSTGKFESNKLMAKANSITKNNKPDLGFLKDPKNLRYAPIAFDALAATGLFGKSPKPETYSPTLIKQQGSLTAPQINEEAMRAKIDAAYQNQIRGIAGSSGGSGAALRSGLMGVGEDYMTAIGQGFLGSDTANKQLEMEADKYNLGTAGNVAAENARSINQGELYNNKTLNQNNALNYDTKMSYLGKGAEGLGDIGYEARNAEILPRMFGYNQYGEYRPLNAKACGGRLKMMRRKK